MRNSEDSKKEEIINQYVEQAIAELKEIAVEERRLIIELGNKLEIRVSDKTQICQIIKHVLNEYIKEGSILESNIEKYCKEEWKPKK